MRAETVNSPVTRMEEPGPPMVLDLPTGWILEEREGVVWLRKTPIAAVRERTHIRQFTAAWCGGVGVLALIAGLLFPPALPTVAIVVALGMMGPAVFLLIGVVTWFGGNDQSFRTVEFRIDRTNDTLHRGREYLGAISAARQLVLRTDRFEGGDGYSLGLRVPPTGLWPFTGDWIVLMEGGQESQLEALGQYLASFTGLPVAREIHSHSSGML
jgi:hypothetical protein